MVQEVLSSSSSRAFYLFIYLSPFRGRGTIGSEAETRLIRQLEPNARSAEGGAGLSLEVKVIFRPKSMMMIWRYNKHKSVRMFDGSSDVYEIELVQ